MSDKVPTLTEMSYATGSLLGPMLGGELYDRYSFNVTADIFAISCLVFAFLYIIVVLVP